MTPLETLLDRLPGAKKAGNGWSARCPAHEDRKASLSIAAGDDGTALVKCHAGCDAAAIVSALGLTLADLFPQRARERPTRNGKPKPSGQAFDTANAAVAELERRHGKRSALWTYHDADGNPVGLAVRWDQPDGKDIRPVARHADGWRIGAMPEPRPLYNLPALATATRVVICEGEKAADAARSLGFVATTSAGGAQAAEKTDWRPLAGKEVLSLPDNNAVGQKFVNTVAGILAKVAPASVVRILNLAAYAPNLPEGGDIADVLSDPAWCGLPLGDAAGPADLAALITRLAEAALIWKPPAPAKQPGPVLTCLADVEPRPVSWLWPGRMPLRRITLLVGRPGEGKSFYTTDVAARVSTGTTWPDGSACPKGSVIIISPKTTPQTRYGPGWTPIVPT
jgi:hypothetical protein